MKIFPRKNYIIRRSVNLSKETHILASNLDQAILVITLKSPRTYYEFIDRFLITSNAYQIPTIIVFSKSDTYLKQELEEIEIVRKIFISVSSLINFTPTLEPSLIGFTTKGNLNFFFIFIFMSFKLSRFLTNFINFGVRILFSINIFFEVTLSIAIAEDKIPE